MAEEIKTTLEDLKEALEGTQAIESSGDEKTLSDLNAVKVIDELGRSYATGKRKDAVARVWIKPGLGNISINGKELVTYFARPVLQMLIHQPFQVAGREGQFDIMCTVKGGGLSGQAGALKHGISKALALFEPELRPVLKKEGFLFGPVCL